MNSTLKAKELLNFIKAKQTNKFDSVTDFQIQCKPYCEQSLVQAKQQILNSSYHETTFQYSTAIDQQKKLVSILNSLMKLLQEVEQLFKNGLEENCLIQGLIGLQNLGTYMIKEFELLKAIQKPKKLQKVKQPAASADLQSVYEEKKRIEIIKTLLFIKQKVANEKLKHMRESIFSNDILIYDYGNVKKINQINSKLQIDGPVIQKQLQDRLFSVKKLISQKLDLEFSSKQQLIDQSKQQLLQQQRFHVQQLQLIHNRATQVKQFVTVEYQVLNQILQQLKGIGFDYIYNSIHENKNIIEYEKQLTKPLTFIESDTPLGQLMGKQNKVIDIEQVIKQIKTWCKQSKIIKCEADYPLLIEQCLEKLKNYKFISTYEIDQLRQLFIQIQKL